MTPTASADHAGQPCLTTTAEFATGSIVENLAVRRDSAVQTAPARSTLDGLRHKALLDICPVPSDMAELYRAWSGHTEESAERDIATEVCTGRDPAPPEHHLVVLRGSGCGYRGVSCLAGRQSRR